MTPGLVRLLLCAIVAGSWTATAAAQAKEDLATTLRALEKEIAAVRGLEFKTPVRAQIIARPANAGKNLQGYYSIQDKTLFLYDDISGAYERGVLIHEMVHALQDQHFGLAKLHQTSFDSDAELALAALIEGDATFTMIELLKSTQPRVAGMLDASLEKAKDVRRAFLYAQGARYVKAVKERGGWASVNFAYKFPPRSTAAILHPEGVRSIDLGPGKTRGELALLELMLASRETVALASQAAAGWIGDRYQEDERGNSWTIAVGKDEDVLELQTAFGKLKAAADPKLKALPAGAGASVWEDAAGMRHAVLARGRRVFVIEAADEAAYQTILDRLEGPLPLEIYSSKDKTLISFGQLVDVLIKADIICMGETHDSEVHHRIQLQVLKALFARDERLGLGLEMFQGPFQKDVDRYLRGESKESEFLATTEYRQRWGFDWSLYQPLVEFCRRNHLPIAALNAGKELTSKISKAGHSGLTDAEKEQLGDVDFQVKEHRDYWYERLAKLHGKTDMPKEQKERSYQVMTIWDHVMGRSAARFQQDRRLRRMLVLAGSGHVEHGLGIPARAARYTNGKIVTVGVEFGGAGTAKTRPGYDFVIYLNQ